MIRAALIALLIAGCVTVPTPFQTGREVGTPAGCIDARSRGHEC